MEMFTIEFQPETPEDVRQMILEGLVWVDGSPTRKILLAARMENIYLRGQISGIEKAQATMAKKLDNLKRGGDL